MGRARGEFGFYNLTQTKVQRADEKLTRNQHQIPGIPDAFNTEVWIFRPVSSSSCDPEQDGTTAQVCLLSLPLFSSPPRCAVYPRVPVEGSRRQRDKLQLVSDLRLQTRSHTPRTEALSKQGPHILSFASRRLDRVLRNADTPAWGHFLPGGLNPTHGPLHSTAQIFTLHYAPSSESNLGHSAATCVHYSRCRIASRHTALFTTARGFCDVRGSYARKR